MTQASSDGPLQQSFEKIAPIAIGTVVATAGFKGLDSMLAAKEGAKLGVVNATRGALGGLAGVIPLVAAGALVYQGLSMVAAPLFEPWTSTKQARRVA